MAALWDAVVHDTPDTATAFFFPLGAYQMCIRDSRLLTHDDGEQIIAGLLRDHLGARPGDPVAASAEARRSRNPEPSAVVPLAARPFEPAPPPPPAPRPVHSAAAERPLPRRRERAPRARAVESDDSSPTMPSYTVAEPPRQAGSEMAPAERGDPGPLREGADGFLQLFINVGKREGVAPGDLQKLLSEAGIAPENTAGIRVRDRMSFVQVRKELFDRAVTAFAGRVFGGRPVMAELARPRA